MGAVAADGRAGTGRETWVRLPTAAALSCSYSLSCELEPPSESASNTLKVKKSTAIVKRWSELSARVGRGAPSGLREASGCERAQESGSWHWDPSSPADSPVTGPLAPPLWASVFPPVKWGDAK